MELSIERFWSSDKSQLTIRTNAGAEAAEKIARHLVPEGYIYWITHPDEHGFVEYTYWRS